MATTSNKTANFYIKEDDLLPELEAVLRGVDGKALVLTGVTVQFRLCDSAGAVIVDSPATIVDALTGVVKYVWLIGDTATSGYFNASFVATFPGAKTITFPTLGFITVLIDAKC